MARRKKKKKNRRNAGKSSSRPKISLCMIVKNEAQYIERCIKSARRAADEIIVVDTGSSDDTAEIARRLGAKTRQHQWKSDFSEARNYSIEQATGDWILYLDADEVLTPDACSRLWRLTG